MYSLSQLSHVPLSDALVQRVLSSFESFPGFLNKRFEQERLLPSLPPGTNASALGRVRLQYSNLTRLITKLVFFKIRATGVPSWPGRRDVSDLGEAQRRRVFLEWEAVQTRTRRRAEFGTGCCESG